MLYFICPIFQVQHQNYLDTFIFVDTAISHVVTPVYPKDKTKPAHRDIFLSITRRMAKIGGSASTALIDKEDPHPTLPLAFALKSKQRIREQLERKIRNLGS